MDCVFYDVCCRHLTCYFWNSGAYLCVKGYGSTASTYALRASYTKCPSDFTEDGREMMCSSLIDASESEKRYTGCSADGMCSCKPPYQKPLLEVYEGKLPCTLAAAANRAVSLDSNMLNSSGCFASKVCSVWCTFLPIERPVRVWLTLVT